ncbi:MAG: ABC transporter ATP-binding protein [Alphaproteobacteria bacterium]|nr:ABC transporter ATP-binding protein [Alphaproteobacteria bacterium]MDE2111467.1 ABC transporter ATP-binding protein [Alphaproteobacteria bacterium]MDE2494270.1 ABC transporter ATP-binding protein [Alphaproteobacteria bacterium]
MIEFDNVSKRYGPDGNPVLHQLSLKIARCELMVLIGESGCGKTTTLNMINRLSEPSAGTVRVDGQDTQLADPVTLRRHIGYVFQGIGLFPHMTVAENIAITPRLLGWTPQERAGRIEELLSLVRLDAARHRNRFPAELSGGQRQRVGLARALAARPKIMLMDEPFGALDPVTRDDLSDDYRNIHDELGLTTVLVTHDMTEAFLMADRVAVMRGGEIVQVGSPSDLIDAPADDLVKAMIESPRRRARKLAAALAGTRP